MALEVMACCGALTRTYANAGQRGRDHVPGCFAVPHQPRRGSDVEAFIKAWRDRYQEGGMVWTALDEALDDYRLRSDVGADLVVPREELGP